jgi:hypothetical protein
MKPFANDQVFEYPLPCLTMMAGHRATLDPWLSQFIGLDSDSSLELLKNRWTKIAAPCLLSLKNYLLEFVPESIILRDGKGWLAIADPKFLHIKDQTICWFVAPPPDIQLLQRRLDEFAPKEIECLHSFLLNFGGLRETIPGDAGDFCQIDQWENLAVCGWEGYIKECRNYDAWRESVMLWGARNGDVLLLDSSGRLGWWSHETNEIYDFLNSFPVFIDYFVKYIKYRYPFSAWLPPDAGPDLTCFPIGQPRIENE